MSKADLRDQLRSKYGSRAPKLTSVGSVDDDASRQAELELVEPVDPERAFVVTGDSGRTVITAPIREVAAANDGFLYLRGRFVEADTPNGNGALWTTEDLQLGEPTVAGGPLNWLHQERKIIGTLLDGTLVPGQREAAGNYSVAERKRAAKTGAAFPDGSYPINNAAELADAIRLVGNSKKHSAAEVRAHIIKRAKALGLTDKLPDGWLRQKAALEDVPLGNHIVSNAALWQFLFPNEAHAVERAAADSSLWFSMECLSREVLCVDGCGESFKYNDYDAGRCCAHLRERSSVRRFVDPLFLGGAIIVPPVQPGWARANVEVLGRDNVRQAAALTEQYGLDQEALSTSEAQGMVAQILSWANRS